MINNKSITAFIIGFIVGCGCDPPKEISVLSELPELAAQGKLSYSGKFNVGDIAIHPGNNRIIQVAHVRYHQNPGQYQMKFQFFNGSSLGSVSNYVAQNNYEKLEDEQTVIEIASQLEHEVLHAGSPMELLLSLSPEKLSEAFLFVKKERPGSRIEIGDNVINYGEKDGKIYVADNEVLRTQRNIIKLEKGDVVEKRGAGKRLRYRIHRIQPQLQLSITVRPSDYRKFKLKPDHEKVTVAPPQYAKSNPLRIVSGQHKKIRLDRLPGTIILPAMKAESISASEDEMDQYKPPVTPPQHQTLKNPLQAKRRLLSAKKANRID